jgi:hypothetical protein
MSARRLRRLVSMSATALTHEKAEMLTSEGVSLSVPTSGSRRLERADKRWRDLSVLKC